MIPGYDQVPNVVPPAAAGIQMPWLYQLLESITGGPGVPGAEAPGKDPARIPQAGGPPVSEPYQMNNQTFMPHLTLQEQTGPQETTVEQIGASRPPTVPHRPQARMVAGGYDPLSSIEQNRFVNQYFPPPPSPYLEDGQPVAQPDATVAPAMPPAPPPPGMPYDPATMPTVPPAATAGPVAAPSSAAGSIGGFLSGLSGIVAPKAPGVSPPPPPALPRPNPIESQLLQILMGGVVPPQGGQNLTLGAALGG
jgi:hypothetical protein